MDTLRGPAAPSCTESRSFVSPPYPSDTPVLPPRSGILRGDIYLHGLQARYRQPSIFAKP